MRLVTPGAQGMARQGDQMDTHVWQLKKPSVHGKIEEPRV